MNIGQLDKAKTRALAIFDEWNRITGCFADGSGYEAEVRSIIEDAVHCGAQQALGVYEKLEAEK